ncbi:histidine kinase [Bacillus thuringiensis]|uniref:histidine kinase n=1 Tax=Bacillus thuringiensis TaxID=1428 RepID=UPI000BEE7AC8|nr:histidine kinase [Bacillus thuringiensis]MED3056279.1 histidine kinase [Bacillus thuringiensis]PDX92902.1 histidine kinase [Bacillus thuringiensis]PEA11939.1 histidine kinase [Bacillus thuringiensis]PES45408.1 histidine kinase [Bacillus thuringiensis]PEV36928.1 histidine kinase [Bacillus thuringiensis]
MIQVIKQKEGNTKLITILTRHSFKYRRLLDGANVEDVQTDKHIPYEQNELQQTLEKYNSKKFEFIKRN